MNLKKKVYYLIKLIVTHVHMYTLENLMKKWNCIKTNPPADGQLVRVRAFVDRDSWYLPTCKFANFVARARHDDEKPEPILWKPIEGANNYWDERSRTEEGEQEEVYKEEVGAS